MNITVITTFGPKQYDEYAKRMLETFVHYWPKSIRIIAYLDFEAPASLPSAVEVRPFPAWFAPWRARHAGSADACGRDKTRNRAGRDYDFKRDCLRFSFKVGALTDAYETDLLIWMDADIITLESVDVPWLLSASAPFPSWMSWINRKRLYPECGFMVFDYADPNTQKFMKKLRDMYWSDEVFGLSETHDSYVIEYIVNNGKWPRPKHLNTGAGLDMHHPFPFITIGERLDHLKGPRKSLGYSPERNV